MIIAAKDPTKQFELHKYAELKIPGVRTATVGLAPALAGAQAASERRRSLG